jgi:pimeloyl-ACP methyl ester carboxylesterase
VFSGPLPVVAGRGLECDFTIPLTAPGAPAVVTGSVTADGCELYYQRRGDGPGLLLITGGGGDSDYYSAMADILASSYTVISYDRRGNSRSGPDTNLMSVSQQGDDALAVLTASGLSSATVFGNSGGATIALDLAARHPSAFPVVVAHEPPLPALLPDGSLLREYEEILDVLDSAGWRAAFTLFMTRMGGLSPEQVAFLADQSPNWEQMVAREMRSFIGYRPDFDAIRAGGSVVVLAAGTASDPRPRQMADAAASALGVEVAAFPGGHTGPLDVPVPFAARLREVLRGVSLPDGTGADAQDAGAAEQHGHREEDQRVGQGGHRDVVGGAPADQLGGEQVVAAVVEEQPAADHQHPDRRVSEASPGVDDVLLWVVTDAHQRGGGSPDGQPGDGACQFQQQAVAGGGGALEVQRHDHRRGNERPDQPDQSDFSGAQVRDQDQGEDDDVEYDNTEVHWSSF